LSINEVQVGLLISTVDQRQLENNL